MEDFEIMHINIWKRIFTEEECNFDKVEEYLSLIKVCADRFDSNRYSESHHILPRSLDKDHKYDKQRCRLNGADHFIVHKKLIECFNGKLKSKMSCALIKSVGSLGPYITPEDYEYVRQISAERSKGNQYARGYIHTEEARKKMSLKHRKKDSAETVKKRSEALKGRKVSKETKEKLSRAMSGENHPMYGKHLAKETKEKLSKIFQGNTNSVGNKWITNGKENRMIKDLKDMPEGWHRGRTFDWKRKSN